MSCLGVAETREKKHSKTERQNIKCTITVTRLCAIVICAVAIKTFIINHEAVALISDSSSSSSSSNISGGSGSGGNISSTNATSSSPYDWLL